jgi:tryptophanyl-tRNA synthetase
MNDWLSKAAPMSRSSCFHSMRCLKELKDISLNDLSEMSRSNVSTMLFLSTDVRRNPEVIKAAKTESDKGFRKEVQRLHPDQHIESFDKMFFSFEQSQRKIVDEVIEMVQFLYGVESKEAAIEVALSFFASSINELKSEAWTNRELFEMSKR